MQWRYRPIPGTFRLTCYWLIEFEDEASWNKSWYRRKKGQPRKQTLTVDGVDLLAPSAFLNAVRMEGAGRIRGKLLNYMGRGQWGWLNMKKYPFGQGASGDKIVPFLSVAADFKVLKRRKLYRVPELRNLLLGGRRHSGIVRASDTGGAIKGRRLDWHVGFERRFKSLAEQTDFPMEVHVEEVVRK